MGAVTTYTYFDDDRSATVTAQDVLQADGTRRDIVLESNTYDRAGHLIRQVTAGATEVVHEVDITGRIERSVLDPEGLNRVTTFTYDEADRLLEQRLPGPLGTFLATSFTYDGAGNVLTETVSDALGQSTTEYTYDQRGLPLTITTPRGFTAETRYDAFGRVVATTAPEVTVETHGATPTAARPGTLTGYNAFGEPTETRDTNGNVARLTRDRLGLITAATRPDYTPPGVSAPLIATSTTDYDALGRRVLATDPLGRTTTYTYNQLGQLVRRTDPVPEEQAAPALFGETSDGPLTFESNETTYTWTPTGLQLSVTGPTGTRAEATYDELGRQLTRTLVERHPQLQYLTTTFAWDDAGNQIASTSPGGVTTRATYNAAGQPLTAVTGGHTSRFGYDTFGRQTETTDPTDRRSVTHYNHLGLPVRTAHFGTDTEAQVTALSAYDADGNTVSSTSPSGTQRTYEYDALGRLTQQTEPVTDSTTITTTFGYDAAGNRTRFTDGRGNSTHYTYTSWGQPESTIEPATTAHQAAADRTWTTVYDAAGQPVTELLPGGVARHRTYDDLGRMVRETGTGAEADTLDRIFVYDLAGNLLEQATDELFGRNVYTYNDRGQLLTATGPGGDSAYRYDADGHMTERTDASGATTFTYDPLGRLDRSAFGTDTIDYSYDAAGRPLSETTAGTTRTYAYDSLGRLHEDRLLVLGTGTEITGITYGYDLDGRITSKETRGTAGAATNTYTYDLAGRMTSWSNGTTTTDYTWDAAGNRTSAGDTTAAYDERNRLLSDGDSSYTYTPRGTLATVTPATGTPRTLTHDAFERRLTDGDSTYSYDSMDRVTERNETVFTYDGGSNNLVSDGDTSYRRDPTGTLLGTDTTRLLTDQHNDVVAALPAGGGTALVGSRAYDPFGEPLATTGDLPALGYQSGWTDPETGDVNMASRWYQPGTGSFTSRDTWQLNPSPSGNANRYAYINGSPLNGIDPDGHFAICAVPVVTPACAGGAAGSAAGPVGTAVGAGLGLGLGIWLVTGGNGSSSSSSSSASHPTVLDGLEGNHSALADAVNAQAGAQAAAAAAQAVWDNFWDWYSGLGSDHGRGAGGSSGDCGGCGAEASSGTIPIFRAVTSPPPPPVDQNPNNGPNPVPAPALDPARPQWDPNAGRWTASQGWDMETDARYMMRRLGLTRFTPSNEQGLSTSSDGFVGPGGEHRSNGDCRQNGRGWVYPSDTDAEHGNRAVGIEACLDEAYLEHNPGTSTRTSPRPPGYEWGTRFAGFMGLDPSYSINNCHLLGKQLSGSGTDLRNLVTCTRQANAAISGQGAIPSHMVTLEDTVRNAVRDGQIVHYRVTPQYAGERTVPYSIEVTAIGVYEDGRPGILINEPVPNSLWSQSRGWRNLGLVSDHRTGLPVPSGSMR